MPRRVFYSFHYQRDIARANVVRNSWVTHINREAAGFFDASVFESKKRTSPEALKRFLSDALDNSSVTCVLIGRETAQRRWVKYELVRSFQFGKGILGVDINGLRNLQGYTDLVGENPLDHLAYKVYGDRIFFYESKDGNWIGYNDAFSMELRDLRYDLNGQHYHTFSSLFSRYNWITNNGYLNIGAWVKQAANQAGR